MSQNKSKNSRQDEDTKSRTEMGDIQKVVEKKIGSMERLRGSRIQSSNRLESYGRKWNFLFFFLNVEAVIIVLLSLTSTVEIVEVGPIHMSFSLLSGIFTLYVILLQYYVNILNYNERALRLSYHQLEVEDLIQQLKLLTLKAGLSKNGFCEEEFIEKYDEIVMKYQLVIKNNENHRDLDYNRVKYNTTKEVRVRKRPKDFTLDMALIYVNIILAVATFCIVFYVFTI